MSIWPGTSQPLGATWEEQGTNFALFSKVAEDVDLCLFDRAGNETRIALTEATTSSGTGSCPVSAPGSTTVTGFTGRGIRSSTPEELASAAFSSLASESRNAQLTASPVSPCWS